MYAVVVALVVAQVSSVAGFQPLPLERLQQEPPLDGRRPLQARISPAGGFVTFLRPSPTSSEVLDLWAQPLPSGAPFALVTTSQLLGGKAEKLTEAERMARERQRISQSGITSYEWCGDDDRRLLFPLSGDLYTATLGAAGSAPVVTRLTGDDAVPEQNPRCSADGQRVAYVKQGNVIVHDLVKNKAKAVTKGANPTRFFGLAEFIAEEELSRHEGFWWSNDGTRLLILEVDESGVAVKTRPQIFADHTEMISQRYPAAGEKNAVVRALVVDSRNGATVKVVLPSFEYVARGGFFKDGMPWLQVLDRAQSTLTLLEIDPNKGTSRPVVVETDSAWVEINDDLRELPGGALLWSSEASGRKQLERLERKSGARTRLTTMTEPVDAVVCADAVSGRVVFSAFADRGRALHLFAKEGDGDVRALTSGSTSTTATADARCTRLLATTSSWGVPPKTTMLAVDDGAVLGTIGGDAGPDPLLASSVPARPVFLDVTAADGKTILNGLWLPPAPKTPAAATLGTALKKPASTTTTKAATKATVPVITYAYGGPTGQVVAHRWAKLSPLFTHWQQLGFGVFLVDTRGMAGRDRAFTRAHKDAFGVVEVEDLKAAIRQLPGLVPSVDPARIGFFGWSYGGYLAVRSVLDDATPVAAAAAVAPVTDWRLYDTAYTERYLGLPATSKSYAASNLVTRAKLLDRPLLLVHGTADDNVLFEHSLQLISALQNEGKLFDLDIYPGKAHGIAGKSSQLHLHRTLTQFFVEHLQP